MTYLLKIIACTWLALPLSVFAEGAHGKRIVIHTETDPTDVSINEVLDNIRAALGEDADANIFLSIDDDGNVSIDKSAGSALHKIVRMKDNNVQHLMQRGYTLTERHRPMSREAANCVLKNLAKVNSDAAAHLVHRACDALNPGPEKPE